MNNIVREFEYSSVIVDKKILQTIEENSFHLSCWHGDRKLKQLETYNSLNSLIERAMKLMNYYSVNEDSTLSFRINHIVKHDIIEKPKLDFDYKILKSNIISAKHVWSSHELKQCESNEENIEIFISKNIFFKIRNDLVSNNENLQTLGNLFDLKLQYNEDYVNVEDFFWNGGSFFDTEEKNVNIKYIDKCPFKEEQDKGWFQATVTKKYLFSLPINININDFCLYIKDHFDFVVVTDPCVKWSDIFNQMNHGPHYFDNLEVKFKQFCLIENKEIL